MLPVLGTLPLYPRVTTAAVAGHPSGEHLVLGSRTELAQSHPED